MKPWRDLSEHEKLDRIAMFIGIIMKKQDAIAAHWNVGAIPGYQTVNVQPSPQCEDDCLGLYGGNLTKAKAA